jgi:hypothetical protein
MRYVLSRFVILVSLAAIAGAAGAETLTVRTTVKGKVTTSSSTRVEAPEGEGLRILEGSEEAEVSVLALSDGTVKSYELKAKDGQVLMVSDGKFVESSGSWQGKPISSKFELKGLGFYGSGFEFALRALARNGLASLKFPMVNMAEPSKSVTMVATREGTERFGERDGIKVKIGLTGLMAAFWSAHVLVAEDGSVLRYRGNQGPGTPDMVTELVEVKP